MTHTPASDDPGRRDIYEFIDALKKELVVTSDADFRPWSQVVAAILRAYPALRSMAGEGEETGWLIEHPNTSQSVKYYTMAPGTPDFWTTDSQKALRFARREDANNYLSFYGDDELPARIVEHRWMPLPKPPATGAQP